MCCQSPPTLNKFSDAFPPLTGRSVASVNLVNVVAHVYACGLIGPEVLYSLLDTLRSRFTENDVALIAAVLRACGARLRADDPVAMKAMVVSVHARAAEAAKASPLSTRTEAMLGLVLDVKNNRAKQGSTATALSQSAARWVAGCGVLDVQLRNLSWPLLLEDNKTVRAILHRWWVLLAVFCTWVFRCWCMTHRPQSAGAHMLTLPHAFFSYKGVSIIQRNVRVSLHMKYIV